MSVEQYGNAVKDLLGLTAAPVLTNRGGEAAYAFFSDVSLGVDANLQFALYQASQDVLHPDRLEASRRSRPAPARPPPRRRPAR